MVLKNSDYIHVDPNHDNLNELIPEYSTNIISINDSYGIRAIEKMFSWSGKPKDAAAHASPTRTSLTNSPCI